MRGSKRWHNRPPRLCRTTRAPHGMSQSVPHIFRRRRCACLLTSHPALIIVSPLTTSILRTALRCVMSGHLATCSCDMQPANRERARPNHPDTSLGYARGTKGTYRSRRRPRRYRARHGTQRPARRRSQREPIEHGAGHCRRALCSRKTARAT
ncbi:uncharacterized protein J3D65DRAFT_422462 [Phyllosticta citribraziliensis]|uniref:Uncharacterized protein n=1 Tax=Phyllosticta citribraziliensis TaxID=989973 RepID=A0ABR1LLX9_9PEZI